MSRNSSLTQSALSVRQVLTAYRLTRSEVDPFQVRAEVSLSLGAAVEENSGSAGGFRDCREAGARNPQTAHHREAARSRETAARSRETAARSREAAARGREADHLPPLANTYGHVDQDSIRAGIRAEQPLQEARLQAHLERNSHKAHDENRRRSLQPQESHPIWQTALRLRQRA